MQAISGVPWSGTWASCSFFDYSDFVTVMRCTCTSKFWCFEFFHFAERLQTTVSCATFTEFDLKIFLCRHGSENNGRHSSLLQVSFINRVLWVMRSANFLGECRLRGVQYTTCFAWCVGLGTTPPRRAVN